MADIVFADTTRQYDGQSLNAKPLGATESSVIYLARELVRRGHRVSVFTHCPARVEVDGVAWQPLIGGGPQACDLYVAVQHPELLGFVRRPKRRAIWLLWQPNHLEHYKRVLRMWWYRPVPILISQHQTRIYSPFPPHLNPRGPHSLPPMVDGVSGNFGDHPMRNLRRLAKTWGAAILLARHERHIVIPIALPDDIRGRGPLSIAPPRRAIFASNPVRGLRQLVEIWATSILTRVPDAVLDVYGIHNLGARDAWQAWEGSFLPPNMPAAVKASVRVHPTVTRAELMEAMHSSRVMLYLGHECEAFFVALAEAQALGVPAVIAPIAALPERVIDGVTGFHRADPGQFAEAAVSLLTDDALWRRQHEACLKHRRGIDWPEAAARFEAALLSDAFPAYPPLSDNG
jgi:glycosyltransferase involved in cell wall biosynthesis